MAMTAGAKLAEPTFMRVAGAGVLSWVLPGLGHIFVGQRRRGLILLVAMALTFWTGVAIGGVQSTIKPRERKTWFFAQLFAGSHTLAAYTWGRARHQAHPDERAGFNEEDVAVIYTGVVGLLNILVILDALASADPRYVRIGTHPTPSFSGLG